MRIEISLDRIRMRVVPAGESSLLNTETLFEFVQEDSIITASYYGGKVLQGYLIGTVSGQEIEFKYVQIAADRRIDTGSSTCVVTRTTDGRIQLIEHFEWASRGGSGTNILEEVVS